MTPAPKIRVRVWDQVVLIGIGLALFYTVFESILSIFLQVNVDFMQRIFGAGPSQRSQSTSLRTCTGSGRS